MKRRADLLFSYLLISFMLLSNMFGSATNTTTTINGKGFKDIKSTTAQTSGKGMGTTVKFSTPIDHNGFAGTFKGNVDGTPANFYCIDLHHYIQFNTDYVVDGNTSPEITYILNNYYPYKAYDGNNGQLNTEKKEAAAVQSAIWHFADGLDLDEAVAPAVTNFTPNEIRTRAKAIVNAAENADDVPVTTLVISPDNQNLLSGTDAVFYVEAYDENNAPAEGVTVTVETTSDGALSPLTLVTDASGSAGPFTLVHGTDNNAVIKASAITVVPQGTRYVHKLHPNNKQKLVLATPSLVEKDVEAIITWYDATDLVIVKTVSNNNPNDEESITYTITVTNSGSVDGTGITVADILPNGLDFISASSGDYDVTTGIWTIGNLAAGASTSLDISVEVDYQSLSVTPIADFGEASDYNLFVLKDATQPSSDTQGKVAVGRNAKFSNYSVGDQLAPSNGTEDVLVVGRKLTYTTGQVFNGNVVYGRFADIQQINLCSDGTIRKADPAHGDPLPVDFALAKTELLALSSQLAAYPANGTTTFEYNGLTLNGDNPLLNVFNVDGRNLSQANSMEINVPNGSVALINVSRRNVTWGPSGLVVNGTGIGNVIYNFPNARRVKISGLDIRGTVLAPKARVNFVTGVIHGQMICNFFEGQGQMNLAPFHGLIPGNPEITNCAEILDFNQPDVDSTNNISCALLTVNVDVDPSGNDGTEWVETNGLRIQEIIWSNFSGSNGMLVGTVGGKIYQAGANGWERLNPDMDVAYIWSLYEDANCIYAGTEQGLFKFDGTDWTKLNYDVDVRAITGTGNTLYAAVWGLGIYTSIDNGANWTEMNSGLELSGYAVQTLTISNGTLFVGTQNVGAFKYNSSESTWECVDVGYNYIWNLAADDAGHIFAATSGGGVYASSDFGETWASVNDGISARHIYTVGIYGSDVFASTYIGGIHKLSMSSLAKSGNSTLTTTSWESVGMTGIEVTSVMFDNATQTLYAATSNGAVYKMIDNTTDVDENGIAPVEFALEQNYPNPFNPSTKINFSIAEAGQYSVKVFNVLGQEVATITNQEFAVGKYTFSFNASNLTSGIYFYKLVGENVNLTKKMMLLK